MKNIVLGIFTILLAFSAVAQTTDKSSDVTKRSHKEGKHFKKDKFEKLNLSDDQKAQMKSVKENFKQQLSDVSKNGGTADEQKAKRLSIMQEHRQKMMSVLNPEQRKQAEEFKKDKCKSGRTGKNEDPAVK